MHASQLRLLVVWAPWGLLAAASPEPALAQRGTLRRQRGRRRLHRLEMVDEPDTTISDGSAWPLRPHGLALSAGDSGSGSSAAGPSTSNRPAGHAHSAWDASMTKLLFDIRPFPC